MDTVSAAAKERARKIESTILSALHRHGQVHVAHDMGVSESTVSKSKEQIPMLAALLAASGLKVVPIEMRCYRPETLDALLTLARERLESVEKTEELAWEE